MYPFLLINSLHSYNVLHKSTVVTMTAWLLYYYCKIFYTRLALWIYACLLNYVCMYYI